jgi:hypothetical protein
MVVSIRFKGVGEVRVTVKLRSRRGGNGRYRLYFISIQLGF